MASSTSSETKDVDFRSLTQADWKKRLTKEQFCVCRLKETEKPFEGEHLDNKRKGVYVCICCGSSVFTSEAKFDSGTGWPSFWDTVKAEGETVSAVITREDQSHGMQRTEVLCRKCDAHLGHLFSDGPPPTGLRYCINSVALHFLPKDTK